MLLYAAQKAAFVEGQVDYRHKLISQYHAEVHETNKKRILDEFRKPDSTIRCLVSTVAFGMGIDIPDVRLIIHWGESDSVSQYWQEVGRGGRDGQASEAHMYHLPRQLNLCHKNMRDMIADVKSGRCIRKAVLTRLTIQNMKVPPTTMSCEMCCNICVNNDAKYVATT